MQKSYFLTHNSNFACCLFLLFDSGVCSVIVTLKHLRPTVAMQVELHFKIRELKHNNRNKKKIIIITAITNDNLHHEVMREIKKKD